MLIKYFISIVCPKYRGDAIPYIEYTKDEIETWKSVWEKVFELLPGRACTTHQVRLKQMINECNASASNIPQMEDVSNYLKSNHKHKYNNSL
jgi:phenylalanine-4-hydroxylase